MGPLCRIPPSHNENDRQVLLELASRISPPSESRMRECIVEHCRTGNRCDRKVGELQIHVHVDGVELESIPAPET